MYVFRLDLIIVYDVLKQIKKALQISLRIRHDSAAIDRGRHFGLNVRIDIIDSWPFELRCPDTAETQQRHPRDETWFLTEKISRNDVVVVRKGSPVFGWAPILPGCRKQGWLTLFEEKLLGGPAPTILARYRLQNRRYCNEAVVSSTADR